MIRQSPLLVTALATGLAFAGGYVAGTWSGEGVSAASLDAEHERASPASDELSQLRRENQHLRETLGSAPRQRETVEDGAATTEPATAGPVDAAALPALVNASDAEAVDFMLQQLEVQLRSGALHQYYAQQPRLLSDLVLHTWMFLGQGGQALADLRRLPRGTVNSETILALGELLRGAKDVPGARETFLLGMRHDPLNGAFVDRIADIDPEFGLSLLTELRTADPTTVDQDFELKQFQLLLACHRDGEAKALLANLRLQGDNDDGDTPQWMNLLTRYSPKLAIELLGAESKADPNGVRQFALARAQQGAGDATAAKASLETLLRSHPGHYEGWSQLTEVDAAAALALCDQLAGANPGPDVLARRARILGKLGRKDEAIAVFERLLPIDWNTAAQGLLEVAPERAMALAVQKGDDEMLGDLADQAWSRGEHDVAERLWRQANVLDPTDSEWIGKLRSVRDHRDPLTN